MADSGIALRSTPVEPRPMLLFAHEGALMTALAVDEHQHLVRAEAAKRRRTHGVGAVGNRRTES